MENLIVEIAKTPLPTMLVMAGILFLFLAIVGKFGANIVVNPQKQRLAGVLGSLLLIAGVILYIQRSPTPTPPLIPPADTQHTNSLKEQIRIIDLQIQELEDELTKIPPPPGLPFELEHFRQEQEEHLSEIENMLVRFNQELKELRPHQSVDPDARESIQKLEAETIPDLRAQKRDVQQQLKKLQEEIQTAQEIIGLEKKIHELKIQKQTLQEAAQQ